MPTNKFAASALLLVVLVGSTTSIAASKFELYNPKTRKSSFAVVTDASMTVTDATGRVFVYKRNRKLDLRRGYHAYTNTKLRQAIRWPIGGKGQMMIARLAFGLVRFKPADMQIRIPKAAAGGKPGGPATTISEKTYYRLSNAAWPKGRALGAGVKMATQMQIAGKFESQNWRFVAAGKGMKGVVRIINEEYGPAYSLGIDPATAKPVLEKASKVKRQLWMLTTAPGPTFRLINAALPGYSLDSSITMKTTAKKPSQRWTLVATHRIGGGKTGPGKRPGVGGRPRPRFPVRKLLTDRFIPNLPLKPVKVSFVNRHRKMIWALVSDARNPRKPLRLKIPVGKSSTATLDRDSGGVHIRTYRVEFADGLVKTETLRKSIPPQLLYDVSVYEMHPQRVVLDIRTKKPKQITYSPKSVGVFPVPPGAATKAGRAFDTYNDARSEKNTGAVRRIDMKEWQTGAKRESEFERILRRGKQ